MSGLHRLHSEPLRSHGSNISSLERQVAALKSTDKRSAPSRLERSRRRRQNRQSSRTPRLRRGHSAPLRSRGSNISSLERQLAALKSTDKRSAPAKLGGKKKRRTHKRKHRTHKRKHRQSKKHKKSKRRRSMQGGNKWTCTSCQQQDSDVFRQGWEGALERSQ